MRNFCLPTILLAPLVAADRSSWREIYRYICTEIRKTVLIPFSGWVEREEHLKRLRFPRLTDYLVYPLCDSSNSLCATPGGHYGKINFQTMGDNSNTSSLDKELTVVEEEDKTQRCEEDFLCFCTLRIYQCPSSPWVTVQRVKFECRSLVAEPLQVADLPVEGAVDAEWIDCVLCNPPRASSSSVYLSSLVRSSNWIANRGVGGECGFHLLDRQVTD